MCLEAEETTNHLLIHCNFVSRAWPILLNRTGMSWVMPMLISNLFWQWYLKWSSIRHNILWNLPLFAGVWKLWLARNSRVFCNRSATVDEVPDCWIPHLISLIGLDATRITRRFLLMTLFHHGMLALRRDVLTILSEFPIGLLHTRSFEVKFWWEIFQGGL